MRLPEQIINDLAEITTKRDALDQREKTLLDELVSIKNVVDEQLAAYKAVGKI